MAQSKLNKPTGSGKARGKARPRKLEPVKTKSPRAKTASARNKPAKQAAGSRDAGPRMMLNTHKRISRLRELGLVDKETMAQFDERILPTVVEYDAEQIKAIRESAGVSQQVFAKYLNASASSVRQWEQGKKKPNGLALKLLNMVANNGLEILG